jgi:hypothetical protein
MEPAPPCVEHKRLASEVNPALGEMHLRPLRIRPRPGEYRFADLSNSVFPDPPAQTASARYPAVALYKDRAGLPQEDRRWPSDSHHLLIKVIRFGDSGKSPDNELLTQLNGILTQAARVILRPLFLARVAEAHLAREV